MIQLFIIIGCFILLICIQMKVYSLFWHKNLNVELKFETTDMFQGQEGCLKEVVTNKKILPLPLFHIRFQTSRNLLFLDSKQSQKTDYYYRNDVFCIGRNEKITRRLKFIPNKRGYYQIKSLELMANDLFMINTMVKEYETNEYIYVYPEPFYNMEFLRSLQMVSGTMKTKRQFLEDPFEYRGMREYQPFDDMKCINWKATAKTGDFKVNLKDFTTVKSVRIFMNLEDTGIYKKEDCAEVCIRMASGIARFFTDKGLKVSLYSNGKDSHTGKRVIHNAEDEIMDLYRSLAKIDLKLPMENFKSCCASKMKQLRTGEYTFILSMNAYEDFISLLQEFSLYSEDFLWFYPETKSAETKIPDSLQRFFRPININTVR